MCPAEFAKINGEQLLRPIPAYTRLVGSHYKRNQGSHDINFLKALVTKALETFNLQFLLADKAYLATEHLDWLWEKSIKAAIPLKKGWFQEAGASYHQAIIELVKWFNEDNNRSFHEVYRLRPKIEALFSILKRMSQEYCWSRGRRSEASKNADEPCTAWINETLCKFIFLNLRTTVSLEDETGYEIDYTLPSRHFPAPDVPLLNRAA
jgi:hypothetical protein